jgi:hypothetical protein
MRALYHDLGDPQTIVWIEKMQQIATIMEDKVLIKTAAAYMIWTEVLFASAGSSDSARLRHIQDLLAFFKPSFADSFVVFILYWSLGILYFNRELLLEAERTMQQALKIANGWHELWWISQIQYDLANRFLVRGAVTKTKQCLLDVLDWHLTIGQNWQMLGFLMYVSLEFPSFFPDPACAMQIITMIYLDPNATDHHKKQIDQRKIEVAAQLDRHIAAEAWEAGKDLDFKEAVALVREVLTPNRETAASSPWLESSKGCRP